jgi:hypothetical protein
MCTTLSQQAMRRPNIRVSIGLAANLIIITHDELREGWTHHGLAITKFYTERAFSLRVVSSTSLAFVNFLVSFPSRQ